jgi:hypothetical protein
MLFRRIVRITEKSTAYYLVDDDTDEFIMAAVIDNTYNNDFIFTIAKDPHKLSYTEFLHNCQAKNYLGVLKRSFMGLSFSLDGGTGNSIGTFR